jgi:hypothetical protein
MKGGTGREEKRGSKGGRSRRVGEEEGLLFLKSGRGGGGVLSSVGMKNVSIKLLHYLMTRKCMRH